MDELIQVCKLSVRQKQILQLLAEGEELVFEKDGGWWIGNDRTNGKLPMILLRHLCISADQYSGKQLQRYRINETGQKSLDTGWLYAHKRLI